MANYIGIDPSITSTAICVIKNNSEEQFLSYIKDYKPDKWSKMLNFEPRSIQFFYQKEKYSYSENQKLEDFEKLTDLIINDIQKIIDKKEENYIGIEDYSYQSSVGNIIDIVTYGTLLRKKINQYFNYLIFSPKQIKSWACKMTYNKDEKGVHRNNKGMAGGNFGKKEMFQAVVDSSITSSYAKWCRDNADLILERKNIAKPIDDITDAWWCSRILENKTKNTTVKEK